MKKKIFALLFATSFILTGCKHGVSGVSNTGIDNMNIIEIINSNNEDFIYINSSKTVEDNIVTITFTYELNPKK